jgi:mono/diheme cytochrome c family protein
MTLPRALMIGVCLGAALVGCGGEPDYPPTSEGLFLRHCSRCHEVDGSSATASKLSKSDIDLRDPIFQKRITDGEIAYIMEFGVGQMQGVPDLTPATVDSILLHVRRLGRRAKRSP